MGAVLFPATIFSIIACHVENRVLVKEKASRFSQDAFLIYINKF
jgi:hypothetical protein